MPNNILKIHLTIISSAVVFLFLAMFYILIIQPQFANPEGANKDLIVQTNSDEKDIAQIKETNRDIVAAAEKSETVNVRKIDSSDHYLGEMGTVVEMIVYGDFECPFCVNFSKTIDKAVAEFGDKIVVSVRHYGLRSHANAIPAALASECSGEQGKFWEMYAELNKDSVMNNLNADEYKKNALELGLDLGKFGQCFDSEKYKEKIINQMDEAKIYGVVGTPTIFINGEIVSGARPFENYKERDGSAKEGIKSIIERHLGNK